MREIVKQEPKLKRQFELIKSIKGVGEKTAIYFIVSTKGFKVFSSARKLACYGVLLLSSIVQDRCKAFIFKHS